MSIMLCQVCGRSFYVKPSHQKLGWGKYCSAICRSKAQFNGNNVTCHTCGKSVYRTLNQQEKSKSKKFFCSKICQTVWRNKYFSGEKNINWKNGESAYRKILKRLDANPVCANCGINDERLLNVHHLDRDRTNNKMTNLVWICLNCHHLVHHDKDFDNKFMKMLKLKK